MSDPQTTSDAPPVDGPPPAARRRWRDDPLSTFLAIAAVLLGGMYLLERRDLAELEDAGARAQALGTATLNIPGCTVGSASTGGRTLVLACSMTAPEAAAAAASRGPDLSGFDTVVFVGSDAQLACAPRPDAWPNGCTSSPRPKIDVPDSR